MGPGPWALTTGVLLAQVGAGLEVCIRQAPPRGTLMQRDYVDTARELVPVSLLS